MVRQTQGWDQVTEFKSRCGKEVEAGHKGLVRMIRLEGGGAAHGAAKWWGRVTEIRSRCGRGVGVRQATKARSQWPEYGGQLMVRQNSGTGHGGNGAAEEWEAGHL